MLWIVGLLWLLVIGGAFLNDSLEYERWIADAVRTISVAVVSAVHRVL